MSEPPAKKARLDGDSLCNEPLNADAPSSPVDDFDDDFYENEHSDKAPDAAGETVPSSSFALPAEPASTAATSLIPGLGSWSDAPVQPQANAAEPSLAQNADVEDGELSDTDAFYVDEEKKQGEATVPATQGALQNKEDDSAALTLPNGDALAAATEPVAPADAQPQEQGDEGKAEFLRAAEANKDNKQAEWQLDSEASDADSSDSSSEDSSSDDDSSEDGELLSPEEAIKRMLAEDPEDDGPVQKAKVKTQNELDEQYTKPDITVTADMKVTPLGKVENVVDNLILIKANTSGDYYVLESGSAVCLENRTVIGQVSETIGRVQDPRYSVGFADAAEIASLGITKDTVIYYVNDHSKFVFTEPLRKEKHTDASGQYDEETNQQEFSDDEEEALHKRELKEKKMERKRKAADLYDDAQPSAPTEVATADVTTTSRVNAGPPSYSSAPLNYDDDEDEDLGMYKPLARPERFEDIVGAGAPIEDRSHVRRGNMRGRGGWVDRGRGFRGRGGAGRGFDRGGMHNGAARGDRGGFNNGGGRGDRGGFNNRGRGDRGGNSNRGDRGDRSNRGQNDRHGRYEQGRQGSGPPQDHRQGSRGAFSPSPARQHQGRQQQPQHSSPRGKGKNRKRNRRDSPDRSSQPPTAANANAYANNSAQGSAEWNSGFSAQAPANYVPPPPPAQAAAAYTNAAYFSAQPQQQAGQTAAQAQINMAQWIQLAAAISQAQQAQGQQQQQHAVPAPPPPPVPQAQPQTQYSYPYQYQQPPAPSGPPAQPPAQPNSNQPSLQDILRVLGNGSGT